MQTGLKCYSIILTGKVQHIGLDYLDGIKTDTGEVKTTLGDMKGSLSSIDSTLGSFVIEQREHNQLMDKHNMRLEKILEKIAER